MICVHVLRTPYLNENVCRLSLEILRPTPKWRLEWPLDYKRNPRQKAQETRHNQNRNLGSCENSSVYIMKGPITGFCCLLDRYRNLYLFCALVVDNMTPVDWLVADYGKALSHKPTSFRFRLDQNPAESA